ncbi:hypothetical protein M514_27638, partial [Trichuris suis]
RRNTLVPLRFNSNSCEFIHNARSLPAALVSLMLSRAILAVTVLMLRSCCGQSVSSEQNQDQLCEANDEDFNRLLLHTEVRWLSKGTCLSRFYSLFDTVLEFLDDENARLRDNLKKFKNDIAYLTELYLKFNECMKLSVDQWHQRMMHVSKKRILQMVRRQAARGLDCSVTALTNCEDCQRGKSTRQPFRRHLADEEASIASRPLDLVHCDLMGPMDTPSLGKARYVLTIIDDATRYVRVYFLRNKGSVLGVFKTWRIEAERHPILAALKKNAEVADDDILVYCHHLEMLRADFVKRFSDILSATNALVCCRLDNVTSLTGP